MNFAQGVRHGAGLPVFRKCAVALIVICSSWSLCGCHDDVRMPTGEQRATFEKVDITEPLVDMTRVRRAELHMGPYRVVPGDVLEFTMPVLLRAVTASAVQAAQGQPSDDTPYICRVNDRGAITLPAVGEMEVAGRSLMEIEKQVIAAYHEHALLKPSVFVRVTEYRTANVYITGGVEKPGVYALRTDQMTLAHLLTEAGGIHKDGATLIRIVPPSQPARGPRETAVLDPRAGAVAKEQLLAQDGGTSVTFTFDADEGTVGRVALSVAGKVLLEKHVDIRNHVRRWAVLNDIESLAPSISIMDLEAKLTDMAGRPDRRGAERANDAPRKTIQLASHERDAISVLAEDEMRWRRPDPVLASRGGEATPAWEGATVLPVHDLNVPFANVALAEGDTVIVEKVQTRQFAVLGLVKNPGNFQYPSDVKYNLAQAIAFAGGLDPIAAPRYVTVYRLFEDGSVGRMPFQLLEDFQFTEAWHVQIRPGDVIAVESTPRTRANTTIHSLLRINTGVYITGQDLWDRD